MALQHTRTTAPNEGHKTTYPRKLTHSVVSSGICSVAFLLASTATPSAEAMTLSECNAKGGRVICNNANDGVCILDYCPPNDDKKYLGYCNARVYHPHVAGEFSCTNKPRDCEGLSGCDDSYPGDGYPQGCSGADGPVVVDLPSEDELMEDSDDDGLADIYEMAQAIDNECDGTIDVRLDGSDPEKSDLFVEVDCESGFDDDRSGVVDADERVCPEEYVIREFVQYFANSPHQNPDGTRGIQVHMDVGNLYGDDTLQKVERTLGGATGSYGNLGNSNNVIPWTGTTQLTLENAPANPNQSNNMYRTWFDLRRHKIYRWNIWVHRWTDSDGSPGSTGVAWTNSNFLLVRESNTNNLAPSSTRDRPLGTLLHEFGHAIGLEHGGKTKTNHIPHYLSKMNYLWQTIAVPNLIHKTGTTRIGGHTYSVIDSHPQASPLAATPQFPELDENNFDECAGFFSGIMRAPVSETASHPVGPVNVFDANLTNPTLTGKSCNAQNSGALPFDSSTNLSGVDLNRDSICIQSERARALGSARPRGPAAPGDTRPEPGGDDIVSNAVFGLTGYQFVLSGPNRICETPLIAGTGDTLERAPGNNKEPTILRSYNDWNLVRIKTPGVAPGAKRSGEEEHSHETPSCITSSEKEASMRERTAAWLAYLGPILDVEYLEATKVKAGQEIRPSFLLRNNGRSSALRIDSRVEASHVEHSYKHEPPLYIGETLEIASLGFLTEDKACNHRVPIKISGSYADALSTKEYRFEDEITVQVVDSKAPMIQAENLRIAVCDGRPRNLVIPPPSVSDACSKPRLAARILTSSGELIHEERDLEESVSLQLAPGVFRVEWTASDEENNTSVAFSEVNVVAEPTVARCCRETGELPLSATDFADWIYRYPLDSRPLSVDAQAGNDTLISGIGNDCILGGPGQDYISVGGGDNFVLGDTEPDNIRSCGFFIGGHLNTHAGDGDDTVSALFCDGSVIYGGRGNDYLIGSTNDDVIFPGPGIDVVSAGAGDDRIVLFAKCELSPESYIQGGVGNDTLESPFTREELIEMQVDVQGVEHFEVRADLRHLSECE